MVAKLESVMIWNEICPVVKIPEYTTRDVLFAKSAWLKIKLIFMRSYSILQCFFLHFSKALQD